MKREKELAIKVMKFANEFTHWNFKMEQNVDFYHVGTTLNNEKGQEMAIYYLIGDGWVELMVISMNGKYDQKSLQGKINKIALRYPVYAIGIGDDNIAINSPMPLEVFDRDMAIIIRERMVDMIQEMTDILNSHK
ncbi:MAG: hypothetical protein OSJ73_11000 [Lachnospiraceae bacterium]|nr:hypothetical protein [Lachnospiraceae bacterium]